MKNFNRRKDFLLENMPKAFSDIFIDFCTVPMQHNIEALPDFSSRIQDDPLELLKEIKIQVHDPIRAQYPMSTVVDALSRWISAKQYDKEELSEYSKRFKSL